MGNSAPSEQPVFSSRGSGLRGQATLRGRKEAQRRHGVSQGVGVRPLGQVKLGPLAAVTPQLCDLQHVRVLMHT